MKIEREIERMAIDFATLCDPLNITLEKQADIIHGYKAGFEAAMKEVKTCNLPQVSKCDGIERRASLIAFIQEKIKNRDMNLYMNASELVDQMLERNL